MFADRMFADQRFIDATLITPDGVSLVSRIWTPQGAGPWPTLLMRQPYGRAIASTVTLPHPLWWTDQGFAVVVQDVRGQGSSEGTFQGFGQEAADTAATLTWLRERPECNGRIGLYGLSYQGLTQLLAPPDCPAPDCLAPAMCGLDEREHWSCEGGAHWWHLGLGWGLQLAALQTKRRNDPGGWNEIHSALVDGRYLRVGVGLLARHDPKGMALRWLQQPADQAKGWTLHRPTDAWLRKPMLLIGGWWDPHLRGLLDLLTTARSSGGNPELHIGPATHLQWWPETNQLLLDFFNQHLKNSPPHSQGKTTEIRLWDQGDATWSRQSGSECSSACWHLGSQGLACLDLTDGQLLDAAIPGSGTCVIVHDPWRPAPAVGGHLSPTAGPCDRRIVDQRSDVAVFSSAPLKTGLQLCGRPVLKLKVSADQPAFDLCAALSKLPAGGDEVQQLSTGVLRVRQATHSENDSDIPFSTITLELQPLLVSFQPGDRLRLSLAGASWPAIAINPGDGKQRFGPPNSDCRVITLCLQLDEATLQMAPLLVPQAG